MLTHQSPFSGLVRLSHSPKPDDIHTPKQQANQSAHEGIQRSMPRHRICRSFFDLQDRQYGPKK